MPSPGMTAIRYGFFALIEGSLVVGPDLAPAIIDGPAMNQTGDERNAAVRC